MHFACLIEIRTARDRIRRRKRGRRCGNLQNPLYVEFCRNLLQHPGQTIDPGVVRRSHKSEMPIRENASVEHRDSAYHWKAGSCFNRGPDDGFVSHSMNAIDDDACKVQLWIEVLATQHKRSGGACHLGDIHYHKHWGLKRLRQFRCAVRTRRIRSVKKSAVAFDQIQSFARRMLSKRIHRAIEAHEPRIEVSCRPP